MFEIGDKVIYQGADKAAYKRTGVVKAIEKKEGKPQLTVELDGGEEFTAPIDDWSRKFENACKNAKFKVGDKVVFVKSGENGIVDEVYGEEWYAVRRDGAKTPDKVQGFQIRAANACVSKNSVVANAMAASKAATSNASASAHFKLFQGMAKSAVDEILYAAEGELRALTGKARDCAEAARAAGDAKAYNDIVRILALLKDAVKKHHSDCLRTIG